VNSCSSSCAISYSLFRSQYRSGDRATSGSIREFVSWLGQKLSKVLLAEAPLDKVMKLT
jgi:hypothetical protein